jgi:hypothetical protein
LGFDLPLWSLLLEIPTGFFPKEISPYSRPRPEEGGEGLHLPIRNKIDLIIRAAKIMIYLLFLEKRKRRRHDSGTAGDIRIHPN